MQLSNKEKQRLQSKYGTWALITGASSGIGKELALQIASADIHVVINARSADKLEQLAQDIKSKYNVKVQIEVGDISDRAVIKQILSNIEKLDIGLFVASAGFGTSGEFIHNDVEEEINMIDVNCSALVEMTHHFANRFKNRGKGGIILMSSMVSFQGVPFAANYAATKAFVQSLVEGLAIELKPHGIDVLAAAPGPVASGFGDRANMNMDMSLTPQQVGAPILKALGRKTTVLPGALTKLLVYSLRTVPRWAKVRIMKMVMGGMTAHQRA